MPASTSDGIQDRPSRPLVVRCGYEGSSRRVNFPSAATCRLESLRHRVEDCFSLSASPFALIYTDDDGEEFSIRSESDLTDAISYFISGDDDANMSTYSGSGSGSLPYQLSLSKVTLRLDVIVEYDGPSLSDTSSISSFQTESERDSAYHSSAYGSSYRSSVVESMQEAMEDDVTEYGEDDGASQASHSISGRMSGLSYEDDRPSRYAGSITPKRRSDRSRAGSDYRGFNQKQLSVPQQPPLTGPESDAAPSLLTHSELGSRWLREQSNLNARKISGNSRSGRSNRYDSDEESFGSDDDRSNNFALVRDARGRYYYSYQTDSSNASDVDLAENDAVSRRLSHNSTSSSASTTSPPLTLLSHLHDPSAQITEPSVPPVIAPDCSACGVRLDYLRYVCETCGEGEMWKENASGKAAFVPPRVPSESSEQSDGWSDATEFAAAATSSNSGSRTVYDTASRSRSGSLSTTASRGSLQTLAGSSSSPTSITYRPFLGPTPPQSPDAENGQLIPSLARGDLPTRKTGYELCAGCIEVHGIQHSKAAARAAKLELSSSEFRHARRAGELRHTFKERIWGPVGWDDVEYNEDTECTICRIPLFHNRFKCVSCSKFDLCRSCYRKVDEIHPAHSFLSLPDKPLPRIGPARSVSSDEDGTQGAAAPQLARHPGAFCHNCLQDIVGPRFHCAVCPSWDLCIQCEGIYMAGGDGSGHLADHIMMKIPVPLPSSEVEAVSRRARDRWFQQDRTVATSAATPFEPSSRSSSPSGDHSTVYAPTATRDRGPSPIPPSQIINVTQRDALDHGIRCGNCTEWIMGRRYQCAGCPSDPAGFNLCSICELRSYKVHDPTHVFLKFDRPVNIPLRSRRAILPPLYRHPVGKVPSAALATINPRDPTAYLKHVMHRETLCDVHGDQIRGVWLRCAHCAAGFDICREAERVADHDSTHVFVVFKARVDMTTFRQVADLAATHSKPLLRQQVYIS
ncbi:hypothetical protein L198_05957 [Cryptococcus wingfieldii CBS 7118]|uniref:ZZ-type domain-containing protein n=1 Tax=Cryptococcus wingfieldii CBS 7118 TaxID=1295528 RepID=A0A1E3IUQ1_9TREE|nr:hypothetical protein L198_05957 [Cryptococcus wingfieldii CBS 7118]ODN91441.1 hypothetical protein L198_05957 [Cryptococcus wingfieldii CBS 7118]